MPRPARRASRLVADHPVVTIAAIVVATIGFGLLALRLERETDFESFSPDDPATETLAEVRTEFGVGGEVMQVLIDSGEGGNVLGPGGLAAAEAVSDAITDAVGDRAALPDDPMLSYADPVLLGLERLGTGPDADPETIAEVARSVFETPVGTQLAGLLSSDLDTEEAVARAGLGQVPLARGLSTEESREAANELRAAAEGVDVGDVTVRVVGQPLLEEASAELTNRELPRLLGLSVVLITAVLGLVFRRISDVVIGLVGLGIALVWTYGLGALLGPGWLGWTGPFTQIATAVPILVAGLGIDFALHLTVRQREERHDRGPRRASRVALLTVGGALTLATATTVVGFLTNLASPLPPIQDFGVFTAVGVLSAFVVMTTLVPAARTLLDRRTQGHEAADGDRAGGEHRGSGEADDGDLAGDGEEEEAPVPLVGPTARLSRRHAPAVLVATVAVSALAVVAGFSVPTTFDTDDFTPSGSDAAVAIEEIERLFGANASERTFVLLEGPVASVEAARVVDGLPDRLSDVEGVRTGVGRALVETPMTLVDEIASSSPEVAEQLGALGWRADGLADDADVAAIYQLVREAAPDRSARVLGDDDDRQVLVVSSDAGQDGAPDLVDRLGETLEPLRDAGVELRYGSQQLVFARTVDALTNSQLRSIAITVGAAALVLLAYFWVRERSVALGLIAMIPTVLVATWVIGSMWVLGLSFNVLTITIGSLAIAIGVDYGIHIAYRFREEHEDRPTDEAIQHTIEQTGGALAGSAATTALGFGVLVLSSILPIRQFGMITALTIVYSMLAAVLVMPAVLHLVWGRSDTRVTEISSERRRSPATPSRG